MEKNDNDIRRLIFKYRSYTPIPFLLVMIWFAQPTVLSLVAGCAVVFTGELIRFWGVSIAGAETRTTGTVGGTFLITNGPFSYVRNPLYVGNMMLYAGVGIMSMALFPWMLLVAIAWFYLPVLPDRDAGRRVPGGDVQGGVRRIPEHVRRFVPRLTPYRSARRRRRRSTLRKGSRARSGRSRRSDLSSRLSWRNTSTSACRADAMPPRVLMIAGEASGDLHGSAVVRALKVLSPSVEVAGVGGDRMRREGMELVRDIADLGFMGFVEVLRNLGTIRDLKRTLIGELERRRPDVVVLIDYPGLTSVSHGRQNPGGSRFCITSAPGVGMAPGARQEHEEPG
jgi:hypothetical protein